MLWFCEIRRDDEVGKKERERKKGGGKKNIWLNKPGSKG